MNTLDCIKTRRSIRKYLDKKIPDKLITEVIEAVRYAPSGCNCQNWQFVVVKDSKTKAKLSNVHNYCSFIKDAPITIVVCYDQKKVKFSPSQDILNPAIATSYILLALHELGLGGCWVYVKDSEDDSEKKVKQILELPEGIGVLSMIPCGYSDEKPSAKEVKKVGDIVHWENW